MPINSFLYPAKNVPVAYEVANSLRFNDDDSAYMTSPTRGTATSQKKGTFSWWMKLSEIGQVRMIGTYENGNNEFQVKLTNDSQLEIYQIAGGSNNLSKKTNRVFRDPSAWMHIVIAIDCTLTAGSEDVVKLYVNGTRETSFATNTNNMPLNHSFHGFYQGLTQRIGADAGSTSHTYDGYFAEFVYIDGQQLDADSFGEFDSDSPNIWKPIDVSGLTFGNNGYYLQFKESGTSQNSSGLGADTSGNDNHFAVTNLAATDQTTDTCTNNFCTVNSLDNYHQQATLSEGNTKITFKGPSSYYAYSTGTFGMASGKWYWETKATSAGNHNVYGISGRYSVAYNQGLGRNTDEYGYYNYNGNYTNAATDGSYREVSFSGGNVTWTTNDIIGIALDLDSSTNTVKFYKNNALIGTVDIIAPSSGFYYPAWNQFDNQAEVCQPNFGNPSYTLSSAQADANGYGAFEYAPPSGYYSLCSKNLAEFG